MECLEVDSELHQSCNTKNSAKILNNLKLLTSLANIETATVGVFRNFAKFTGKHICQRLVFNKVAGQAYNFIKKESLVQLFSCEFCKISKNTFFTEHL